MVGMHLQDAADTLGLILDRVEHAGACVDRTGIDTEEAELADIGVGRDFERQRRKRLLIGRRSLLLLAGLGVDALDVRNIRRSGHIVDDRVEQHLHALVAVGSTAQHGNHLVIDGRLADYRLEFFDGKLLAFEIFFHQALIQLRHGIEQSRMIFLSLVLHFLGNLLDADVFAQIVVIDLGLHRQQIDNTLEIVFFADRQLDRNGVALKTFLDHVEDIIKVCAHNIHLVHVDHTRNMILVCLTPNRFRLRFDAALGAHDGYGTVEYAQRALNLHGEVHVSGRVDDVDAVVFPVAGGGSRSDRNAALLFLGHPVHRRSAVVRLANLVIDARVIQNTFCCGRLTGIDMSHDTDISGHLQRDISWHCVLLKGRF